MSVGMDLLSVLYIYLEPLVHRMTPLASIFTSYFGAIRLDSVGVGGAGLYQMT